MPGPRPEPTKLTILKGNPGKKRLNVNEPKPRPLLKVPGPPKYLTDKVARKEWKRISKELFTLGLLTNLDITALAGYCTAFADWVRASKAVEEHGSLVKAQSGFPVQSPWVGIAGKAMVEMRRWATEFGMTPSARSKVAATKRDDDEDDGTLS